MECSDYLVVLRARSRKSMGVSSSHTFRMSVSIDRDTRDVFGSMLFHSCHMAVDAKQYVQTPTDSHCGTIREHVDRLWPSVDL